MKKKLLYISDSTIPSYSANSIHVMKMCQAFSNLGYDVTLIGKRTRGEIKDIKDPYSFYGVKRNFRLKLFPFKSFFFSGRLYNFLLPFFSFSDVDIVYTRSIYAAFWYTLFKNTIVFEIHEPYDTKNAWLNWVFNRIIAGGKVLKWVVISAPLKDYLISEFNIQRDKILIAHDGADPTNFNELKKVTLKEGYKVGYVGSLLKGKGVEIIFELSDSLKNIDFHVVGGESEQIKYWNSRRDIDQNNLIFHGFVSPKETSAYLLEFDILIAPYQKEVFVKERHNSNNIAKYMSPLKIFEYMSAGKPIITSDLPVLKEVLSHNETAILCDPENLGEWESAILLLKNNKELGYKLSKEAKITFENNYTWDQRAMKILNFLKN